MKLNHINLGVTDVAATVALFEKYFGLRVVNHMPQNDFMAFTNDENDALISVFKANDVVYPKIFHIGFLQDTVEQVNAIHAKLVAGGFDPGEAKEEYGRFVFYLQSPGGFMIEVSAVV
jgi:lactoylglutathione lyase